MNFERKKKQKLDRENYLEKEKFKSTKNICTFAYITHRLLLYRS